MSHKLYFETKKAGLKKQCENYERNRMAKTFHRFYKMALFACFFVK